MMRSSKLLFAFAIAFVLPIAACDTAPAPAPAKGTPVVAPPADGKKADLKTEIKGPPPIPKQ